MPGAFDIAALPAIYRIVVLGRLEPAWSHRLGGMQVDRATEHVTVLHGELADQAALMGVLNTLYALGMSMQLVERVSEQVAAS